MKKAHLTIPKKTNYLGKQKLLIRIIIEQLQKMLPRYLSHHPRS